MSDLRTAELTMRLRRERDEARAEVERLRAAVQAVRDRHQQFQAPGDVVPYCGLCRWAWPCPTIRDIDAALGGERDE